MKRSAILFVFFLFMLGVADAGQPPQRIISLGPSITEEIYLLRAGDRLVGCATY